MAEHEEKIAEPRGEPAHGVIPAAGRRQAVAGEVGDDHGVIARQRLDHRPPVLGAAAHTVDQEQDRARAGFGVAHRAAVQRLGLDLHQLSGWRCVALCAQGRLISLVRPSSS